ncbi:putative negative regulation of gluconeogenesis-related protein [Dioszegia hungarica]|uniref:GID complex catalytic subunit 2 n=1 Tax=Dioszegia hungarica TaxID=4972 RepID=A0AA38HAV9_9TREE|nr:putative negative regulation of gluconeogenesis-related protein [Dioszegia hungarica]KAI9635619.1 putative negative regulation of gluconeogenesis-related protein [Dioszegia hungarica]
MNDIDQALSALEALASEPGTSASGPIQSLLDKHFATAREQLQSGSDPTQVIQDLIKAVAKSKKEVEKGLKGWYNGLGIVGKAVEKAFPPNLAGISDAYNDPPLFSEPDAAAALDRVILDSLGRRGLWEAVDVGAEEMGVTYENRDRGVSDELYSILNAIEAGDLQPAISWCEENASFLATPPHPSSLPYYLHRSVFLRTTSSMAALEYARTYLMVYMPTQPVLQLITSSLYPSAATAGTPYNHDDYPLSKMFQAEFCRRHGMAKEELLEVAVDLGGKGGALGVIEKARRVMGERLGNVRTWQDLPLEVPLPSNRRYHSVFVCPVSKEQATEANPPKMLTCGHVLAQESLTRMLKGGRRTAKCPYCPVETAPSAAQRLYF